MHAMYVLYAMHLQEDRLYRVFGCGFDILDNSVTENETLTIYDGQALTLPYLTLPYLTLPYLTLPHLTLPYLTLGDVAVGAADHITLP